MKSFVLLIFMITPSPVVAQEAVEVTLGSILFPSNTKFDPITNRCIGKSIDRTRDIMNEHNIKVNVVYVSAIRIYRMIENGEIDFVINPKSTRALKPYVSFVDTPFAQKVLNLYKHKSTTSIASISAVRGFDYVGHRQLFKNKHSKFIDVTNTKTAIEVFLKRRSDALLSYEGAFRHYIREKDIDLGDKVEIQELTRVNTYYAISKSSKHHQSLLNTLLSYEKEHQPEFFLPQVN